MLTTVFFAASALYGVLNFSPFAYQQFIRPRLVPWLAWSAAFYGGLFMAVFSRNAGIAARRRAASLDAAPCSRLSRRLGDP